MLCLMYSGGAGFQIVKRDCESLSKAPDYMDFSRVARIMDQRWSLASVIAIACSDTSNLAAKLSKPVIPSSYACRTR